jgi:hypothetical protein
MNEKEVLSRRKTSEYKDSKMFSNYYYTEIPVTIIMYKKITMVLTIAAILTAYMSALMLSNQAFAQSAAGQEAKQLPGGHSINPGGPIQLPGGHSINPGGPILITCLFVSCVSWQRLYRKACLVRM